MSIILPIVAPVFAIIVLGLVAARAGYISEGADKALIELVFRIAIPALLVRTIVAAPAITGSPLQLWGAFFGAIVSVWVLATLGARLLMRRPAADSASLALGSCFGNLVLLALPITLRALGPEAATPMAIIFLVEFPVMWIAATLQHQYASAGAQESAWAAIRRTLVEFTRNPILIAIAVGAAWRATGLGLEATLGDTLDLVARAATPVSLVALGVSLARLKPGEDVAPAAMMVALKLLVLPIVAWVLAFHVFTLPPLWSAVVVIFASMPIGAVAFLFASRVGRAVAPVSLGIAMSVALSAVTVSAVLYLLSLQPGVVLVGR